MYLRRANNQNRLFNSTCKSYTDYRQDFILILPEEMTSKSCELVKSVFLYPKRRKNQMFPSWKKYLEQSVCEHTFFKFLR